jgi:hypothetical protein
LLEQDQQFPPINKDAKNEGDQGANKKIFEDSLALSVKKHNKFQA